jgi:hypothetical protein
LVAVELTLAKLGHLNLAISGHSDLASTTEILHNRYYVNKVAFRIGSL